MRDPCTAERRADRSLPRGAAIRRRLAGGRDQALRAEDGSAADARGSAWKRLRREDGQALVEFAIILPLLLTLVTGLMQFGLLFNQYITLTDAVRNGARTLALGRGLSNPCDPAVLQTLNGASGTGLTSGRVSITFSSGSDYCGTGGSYVYNSSGNTNGAEVQGDQATVSVSQPFTLGVFGLNFGSLNLTASASDAIE